jgi:ATP-dependent exoDNAse (exonuclease V) alpha subunit
VLVVDEASMADTRTLAAILVHAEERDARVVLVGDPAQLPAVGPGGLFAALCEREGAVRLDGNRRQHAAWERDALTDLRAGRVEDALSAYAAHGRVAACEDPGDAHARLVADWWDAAQRVGKGEAIMLAHRRTDVRALNGAAREHLRAAGHLDGPAIDVGGREYQVGDRVIARTNDRRLGIRNGTRATITHIDAATGDIRVQDDHGSEVTLPPAYAARSLDHAYALTVHAAQGATVTHAFVLASDQARLAEWGYVALSRAQATTRIYVLDTTDARPLGAIEPARPGPTLDDLVDRLRGRAAEPLATDQIGPSPVARAQTARHGPRDQTRDLGHDM